MSHGLLTSDWLNRFSDPYAVLGVSVAADDRRVLKRYRSVAKVLHPDAFALDDTKNREFASQLFARLINPAYQKLKQEKDRAEASALLRFQVRRLSREGPLSPNSDRARRLMRYPASEVDVFYEQAIAELAETQFQTLDQFEAIASELTELNLVYFQLKMGEVLVREKRTGLVAAAEAKPVQFAAPAQTSEAATESYSRRHYRRAQEYIRKGNPAQAVQELRDAIKIEADQSEYHALLGVAYLQQNLTGMATVYLRQALKLNPNDPVALKFASRVGIPVSTPDSGDGKVASKGKGLFGGMFRAKR